jgi:hypothetical protein
MQPEWRRVGGKTIPKEMIISFECDVCIFQTLRKLDMTLRDPQSTG